MAWQFAEPLGLLLKDGMSQAGDWERVKSSQIRTQQEFVFKEKRFLGGQMLKNCVCPCCRITK